MGVRPPGATSALLLGIRERRSGEFTPLSKIENALGDKECRPVPTRIKFTPWMIDDNGDIGRRTSYFNAATESFVYAVRDLMFGYALVSAVDVSGAEWCNIEAATARAATAGYYFRRNSKRAHALHSRIMKTELTVSADCARLGQSDRRFPGSRLFLMGETTNLAMSVGIKNRNLMGGERKRTPHNDVH